MSSEQDRRTGTGQIDSGGSLSSLSTPRQGEDTADLGDGAVPSSARTSPRSLAESCLSASCPPALVSQQLGQLGRGEHIVPTSPTPPITRNDSHPPVVALPPYQPTSSQSFLWDARGAEEVACSLDRAYTEIVHWRPNVFTIPLGSAGKRFVEETCRLAAAFAESKAEESVALLALMVMPALLLQQPRDAATHRERVSCLDRRMKDWTTGKIEELLLEGRVIQRRLDNRGKSKRVDGLSEEDHLTRAFQRLMLQGKVKSALRLLSTSGRGHVLSLDEQVPDKGGKDSFTSVREALRKKHPLGAVASSDVLLQDIPPETHTVIFDQLNGDMVRSAALHTQGSAGPSGLDASNWRRLCTMYHGASKRLCSALAGMARRLCTSFVDPCIMKPLIACRLIPLSKNPGVRPIGVCETLRRIIGKGIMRVVGPDIQAVAGTAQLCARQKSGCETAVHAMHQLFAGDIEGVLLVDASNAFNSLNRQVMLHNIQVLCPAFATCVINYYRSPAELYVGGDTILSNEGTTQGDPLSMAIYALATLPLIDKAKQSDVKQTWFADDAGAGGRLMNLLSWWNVLRDSGPKFGYFVNPPKSWLIVKDHCYDRAKALFHGSGIQITKQGRPLLGAPLGTGSYTKEFCQSQVATWVAEIKTLSKVAAVHPHAAYAALLHGLSSKWSYLSRACPGMEQYLDGIEQVTRLELIPALCGHSVNDIERELLGLPARFGGLGIPDATENAPAAFKIATNATAPLVRRILDHDSISASDAFAAQSVAISEGRRVHVQELRTHADSIKAKLPAKAERAMEAAQERGASTWLTALPLAAHGFSLSKGEFRDALCLRYGWEPPRLPSTCSCGQNFTVQHALSCTRGGYVAIRHNELRDLFGELLRETCHNIDMEPPLQPLSGETFRCKTANIADGARVDIKAGGFWGSSRHEVAYFDVRVFNPHANSYRCQPMNRIYRQHESEKRRQYEQRIREVDNGSFTPLVFSSSGGAGPAATVFLKRLGSMLAEKMQSSYAEVMGWLRCRVAFALLRSSILCLRGSRPRLRAVLEAQQPTVALAEAKVEWRGD